MEREISMYKKVLANVILAVMAVVKPSLRSAARKRKGFDQTPLQK